MLRFLLALSLILSLVTPHETGAQGAAGLSADGHAGHHSGVAGDDGGDDDLVLACCDAIVGGCSTGALVQGDMTWPVAVHPALVRYLAPDRLPDGLRPSFDPPPPRV